MPKRATFNGLLDHPVTKTAVQQLAQGIDPRLVAAQIAGNALQEQIARAFGMLPVAQPATTERPKRTMKIDPTDSNIIDVEFTVVDVSPGVKKKRKAG